MLKGRQSDLTPWIESQLVRETFTHKMQYRVMARKGFKPEQIIHMLREAEIRLAGGSTVGEVCRALGILGQSYYRWRKEYGGMQVSQAKKLKDLERENARLKKRVADQALDKASLTEPPKSWKKRTVRNVQRLGVYRHRRQALATATRYKDPVH
jgi:transposase-like protein